MAIEKFVVGKSYKWTDTAEDFDYFVVQDLFDGQVYYTYPEWNDGKGFSTSGVVLYTVKSKVVEYLPEKENKLEVKPGQKFERVGRWSSSFRDKGVAEIKSISEDTSVIYMVHGGHDGVEDYFATKEDFERSGKSVGYVLVEDAPEENNTLSPNVYQRPNGVEVRSVSSTGAEKGVKASRFSLLPVEALTEVANHYGVGATKYEDHNMRRGYEWSKSYDALMRHATQFWAGEDYDEETGSKHLSAVVFHALTLMEFMETHPEFDDRYKLTK